MKDILEFTDIMDAETEFFPLLSTEDEEKINAEEVPDQLPILPLRNTVLFPGVVIPITVGRDKSITLMREAYRGDRTIGVVAQKDPDIEDPFPSDLHKIGTVARLIKILQMPDGNTTAIIQGKKRFELVEMVQDEPYFKAKVKAYEKQNNIKNNEVFEALISSVKDINIQIIEKSPGIPSEAAFALNNIESPFYLINFVSSNLKVGNDVKQSLLEMTDMEQKSSKVLELLTKDLQLLDLKQDIQKKVKVDMDKQQRDFMLHQQLKTIQDELGGGPHDQEINDLTQKAKNKKWPKEVGETFGNEMSKLQRMNPSAAEYSIQLNYLELYVELPWNEYTIDNLDLNHAKKVLNDDHFGLDKIKERIIEYLAVLKAKKQYESSDFVFCWPSGGWENITRKINCKGAGTKIYSHVTWRG